MLNYNPKLKSHSRRLRTDMTEAEQKLWERLRGKQLHSVQFYRQKPLATYIVDFYGPKAKLVIELGRFLVGEAGVYVARVIDRKVSRGEVFLVTDGGLHHHLSASGNFGQVIRKNYPVEIGTRGMDAPREVASVVGPLCTPLDLLADRMQLAEAGLGDLVVVFQSGAYGITASPMRFLSHPAALEVLV